MSKDILFLRLSKEWALAYNPLQWIVQRRAGFDKRRSQWNWKSVSFVASNRDTLLRVLREIGAKIDPDKMAALLALPTTFREWFEQWNKRDGGVISDHGVSEAA